MFIKANLYSQPLYRPVLTDTAQLGQIPRPLLNIGKIHYNEHCKLWNRLPHKPRILYAMYHVLASSIPYNFYMISFIALFHGFTELCLYLLTTNVYIFQSYSESYSHKHKKLPNINFYACLNITKTLCCKGVARKLCFDCLCFYPLQLSNNTCILYLIDLVYWTCCNIFELV